MQLEQMYQEIILDHYRSPHGAGLRDPFDAESMQINPTCGDEITLRLRVDGDTVAEGDTIVVLEAMKMEQPLKAHKAGIVSGLKAEVGSGVTNGEVICEIKDAAAE